MKNFVKIMFYFFFFYGGSIVKPFQLGVIVSGAREQRRLKSGSGSVHMITIGVAVFNLRICSFTENSLADEVTYMNSYFFFFFVLVRVIFVGLIFVF